VFSTGAQLVSIAILVLVFPRRRNVARADEEEEVAEAAQRIMLCVRGCAAGEAEGAARTAHV